MYRIFSELTIDWNLAVRCAWLGIPESVFGLALVGPDIAIVSMLAAVGPTAIAAFRALNVVSDLTFVVPSPLQSATQTVIGQRLGARDIPGAQWFLGRALRTTLLVSTLTGAIVAIFAWPLSYLFTLERIVATAAALAARTAHAYAADQGSRDGRAFTDSRGGRHAVFDGARRTVQRLRAAA